MNIDITKAGHEKFFAQEKFAQEKIFSRGPCLFVGILEGNWCMGGAPLHNVA